MPRDARNPDASEAAVPGLAELIDNPDLVIDVEHATVTRSGTDLIRDISWRVELDERWVVLGPNGAGKTTLLSLAAARVHPSQGRVAVLGERVGRVDLAELRTRIGLATVSLNVALSVSTITICVRSES